MLYARYQSRFLVWFASVSLLIAFWRDDSAIYWWCALIRNSSRYSIYLRVNNFWVSIALYTAIGGFRASVLNDALQGLVMLLGTVILLVAIIYHAGGLPAAIEKCIP